MPAVTIADAVRVSDSVDTKAVLQADSTTQYFLPPRMTTAQKNAIASPAEGAVVFDTDLNYLSEYTGATWQAAGGGSGSGAPTTATYITQTSDAGLSAEQALSSIATGLLGVTTTTGVISSGGVTGATDNALLRADGTGGKTVQTSTVIVADTGAMTNVLIDADGTGNVITNIGSSEVKAELITGLTADASPDGAADYVMTYDNSATALKKVLLNNLPGVSKIVASGTYTPGSAYTTNSTSMVDVDATNVKQTVTLNGGGVTMVTFTFRTNKQTAGNGFFRITDGTNHSNEIPQRFVTNNDNTTTCHAVFDALSAGSTTFKLQYRSSDANNIQIIISLPITWSVVELS